MKVNLEYLNIKYLKKKKIFGQARATLTRFERNTKVKQSGYLLSLGPLFTLSGWACAWQNLIRPMVIPRQNSIKLFRYIINTSKRKENARLTPKKEKRLIFQTTTHEGNRSLISNFLTSLSDESCIR